MSNHQDQDPFEIRILTEEADATSRSASLANPTPVVPENGDEPPSSSPASTITIGDKIKRSTAAAGRRAAGVAGAAMLTMGKHAAILAGKATRRLWRSRARKAVTDKMGQAAAGAAARSQEALTRKVNEIVTERLDAEKEKIQKQLRETDWRETAKNTTGRSVKWLSQQLDDLSERVQPTEAKSEKPKNTDVSDKQ